MIHGYVYEHKCARVHIYTYIYMYVCMYMYVCVCKHITLHGIHAYIPKHRPTVPYPKMPPWRFRLAQATGEPRDRSGKLVAFPLENAYTYGTLWLCQIAIENDHRNSEFSH